MLTSHGTSTCRVCALILLLTAIGCGPISDMMGNSSPSPAPTYVGPPRTPSPDELEPPTQGPRIAGDQITVELLQEAQVLYCVDLDAGEFRRYDGEFPITAHGEYLVLGKARIGNREYVAQLRPFLLGDDTEQHPLLHYSPSIYFDGEFFELWHGNISFRGTQQLEEECEKLKALVGEARSIEISTADGIFPEKVQFEVKGIGYFSGDIEQVLVKEF